MDQNQPENINPEEFKESMLKTTAITFSLEGMSRDLETYIQKKITFNNRNFKHLSSIISSISTCGEEIQKKLLNSKGALVTKMLQQSLEEQENINAILTFVIQKVVSKESSLNSDLEDKDTKEEN